MACRDALYKQNVEVTVDSALIDNTVTNAETQSPVRLLFGVDSQIQSDDMLQNNISQFEWVVRNKAYPIFWGRNIVGQNALTKEEIDYLHKYGCKIAATYTAIEVAETEEQGESVAAECVVAAEKLDIPFGTALFLELKENENVTTSFMRGFARRLVEEGFTPAFKANTDANFNFDREFSRGLQVDKETFSECLVWAVTPSLVEYERVTTTHIIHPDNWSPFAPSGITRSDIAIWQYGRDCHPINDDAGVELTFNVNLVRNEQIILEKMF